MYKVRPHDTEAVKLRQKDPKIEILATNDAIPLDENWSDRWCTLSKNFELVIEDILNLEIRADDVFVVTYMKSGTTWMQEMAWLLINNLDYETAKEKGVLERSVFLDFAGMFTKLQGTLDTIRSLPSPRLIKSHLPASLLPHQLWQNKRKIIYVARNVKDVVVSSFHFMRDTGGYIGTIEEYAEDFMSNEIMWLPYWPHVIDFWKMRHEPFIFFVTYEEMKRNLAGVVQRLCDFLERPALNDLELSDILDHLSFEKMKNNKQTNLTYMLKEQLPSNVDDNLQFMRRGIIGSYKDELTPELQKTLNLWSKSCLEQYGVKEEDIFGNF